MPPSLAQQFLGRLPPYVPRHDSWVASAANLQVSPENHDQPVAAPGQEEAPWENVPQEGAVCGMPDGAGRQGHCCCCCIMIHVLHVGLWAAR